MMMMMEVYMSNTEVSLLTISREDIIDNLDDYDLSQEQKDFILGQDDNEIVSAIDHATRHFELGDYYLMAIEDTIEELKREYNDDGGTHE